MGGVSRRNVSAGTVLVAFGMVLLLVQGAGAASVTPVLYEDTNVFCTAPTDNQTGLGLELVAKFGDGADEHPLVDGESTGGGITVDLDVDGGTVLSWDSGDILIGAVIVKGGPDSNVYFYPGGATGDTNLVTPLNPGGNRPAISHIDFCAAGEPDEVDVQVALGACVFNEDTQESETPLTVTISGDGGATVTVKDESDTVVGTFTESGSMNVLPGTYSFETAADPGSELSEGSDASGTLVAGECAPEVLAQGSVSVTTGACVFEDGQSNTPVEVLIAPSGAATVTIDGVGTFTGSGGTATLTPGSYDWSATANEGFELIAPTSGTVTADQCLVVLPRGPLPRTGTTSTGIAIVGSGVLLLGWAIRWGERKLLAD